MATLSEHSEALLWGLGQLQAAFEGAGVLNDPEIAEPFARFREAVDHVRFAAVYEEISISQPSVSAAPPGNQRRGGVVRTETEIREILARMVQLELETRRAAYRWVLGEIEGGSGSAV